MIDIQLDKNILLIELLLLSINTRKYLTVRKQTNANSF